VRLSVKKVESEQLVDFITAYIKEFLLFLILNFLIF